MQGPWILLAAIVAVGILYVVVPVAMDVFARYRGGRSLTCPETGAEVRIELDARHAALTAVPGPPRLRVADCTLWPGRGDCLQGCIRRVETPA